jgi:mRNA interferase YafQ
MRTINRTNRFRKDYKRELRGRHGKSLDAVFEKVLAMLAMDQPLPAALRDHALTGEWKDSRDCHIKPDLVLVYRLIGNDALELDRIGSHSELGL